LPCSRTLNLYDAPTFRANNFLRLRRRGGRLFIKEEYVAMLFTKKDYINRESDDVLFRLEFKFLPKIFYDDPDKVLKVFFYKYLHGENWLYKIFKDIAEAYNCPDDNYTAEDFKVAPGFLECTKDTPHFTPYVLLFFPKGEIPGFAHQTVMFYTPADNEKGYYTVEYDYSARCNFACGVGEDGSHLNFGALYDWKKFLPYQILASIYLKRFNMKYTEVVQPNEQ